MSLRIARKQVMEYDPVIQIELVLMSIVWKVVGWHCSLNLVLRKLRNQSDQLL